MAKHGKSPTTPSGGKSRLNLGRLVWDSTGPDGKGQTARYGIPKAERRKRQKALRDIERAHPGRQVHG